MKFKITTIACLVTGLAMTASPATAQHYGTSNGYQASENRISLGLTIPFGGHAEEAKPRMELSLQQFDNRQNNQDFSYQLRSDRITRDNRIGFSLTKAPQLMLNGKHLALPENQINLSDGAVVALGLGVAALGVLVWATAETVDELEDISNPD